MSGSVSEARQWGRLMALAEIGGFAMAGSDDFGVNRPCLSELDRRARRMLVGWGREIGCAVSVDEAANLFLRYEGTDPSLAPVLTGSHMDTQPQGGRFDGIWGVVAGLEAICALHDAGAWPRRAIELVAWTNEEGGRFRPGCTGSMSWAGHTDPAAFRGIRDGDGIFYGDALDEQLRHRTIPSGAFHDAQFVVPVCPMGMIFVPSRRGISHNPAEYSSPAQLAAGARVLARTLATLAG